VAVPAAAPADPVYLLPRVKRRSDDLKQYLFSKPQTSLPPNRIFISILFSKMTIFAIPATPFGSGFVLSSFSFRNP
jgi:hypothetical protein